MSAGSMAATAAVLADAARRLAAGGVVALPTDTVYGLGIDARNEAAGEALFALKGRPAEVALPVLVAGIEDALALVADGTEGGGTPARPSGAATGLRRLAERFWPGPLTVVVPLRAGLRLAIGGDGTSVGLRAPGHHLARELLRRTGPLAVTSANRHGRPPCTSAEEVEAAFAGTGLLVIDGGRCDGQPSSVVSLLGAEPVLLRRGPIGLEEIVSALAGDR